MLRRRDERASQEQLLAVEAWLSAVVLADLEVGDRRRLESAVLAGDREPGDRAILRIADVDVELEEQRPVARLHADEHRRLPAQLAVESILSGQGPARDALAGGQLELRMVPSSAQVVGAHEPDVGVASSMQLEEGLVLRRANVDPAVEHLGDVVVARLGVAIGAEREDFRTAGPDHRTPRARPESSRA